MKTLIHEDLKCATEEKIRDILNEGITSANLEYLGELMDIHKDIANEKYWSTKEEGEDMRYGNYPSYNNYEPDYYRRDNYGARRRDSRGRYRGHDYLDEMYNYYGRYAENMERYGASEETDKSFHYMVKALEDFIKVLHEEAETPQQKQMLHEVLENSMR